MPLSLLWDLLLVGRVVLWGYSRMYMMSPSSHGILLGKRDKSIVPFQYYLMVTLTLTLIQIDLKDDFSKQGAIDAKLKKAQENLVTNKGKYACLEEEMQLMYMQPLA